MAQARKAGSAAWGWTWIHSDHLQSATVLADKDGNPIRRLAYKAFGEEIVNTGSGDAPPYTYTGKELDSSGLMYYGARYYDPALARFITPDTVYDAGTQGLNRYAYALNNPIRYTDPTGHGVVDWFKRCWANANAYVDSASTQIVEEDNWRQAYLDFSAGSLSALVDQYSSFASIADSSGGLLSGMQTRLLTQGVESLDHVVSPALFGIAPREESVWRDLGNVATQAAVMAVTAEAEASSRAASASDDLITFYHATSKEGAVSIKTVGIDLAKSRSTTDFGRGFYVTAEKSQALDWIAARHPGGELLEFRVPRSAFKSLRHLDVGSKFSSSLARFIRHNRLGGRLHSYDVVSGPMLGNPGKFLRGSAPRFFGQQTSFHSEEALRILERSLIP